MHWKRKNEFVHRCGWAEKYAWFPIKFRKSWIWLEEYYQYVDKNYCFVRFHHDHGYHRIESAVAYKAKVKLNESNS